MNTISTKQIREDIVGFLQRLQEGERITVIHRSRPLVTLGRIDEVKNQSDEAQPGSVAAIKNSVELIRAILAKRNTKVKLTKSYDQMYDDHLEEKYGAA